MRFSRTWHHPAQLEFVFEFAVASLIAAELFDDDEFDAFLYPVRKVVSAVGLAAPETRAPRSIFEMASSSVITKIRNGSTAAPPPPAPRIHRADGVTRCHGAAYPSRWTPEDEERERQRRARQRPPKPVKGARTRSKKLIDLVGSD